MSTSPGDQYDPATSHAKDAGKTLAEVLQPEFAEYNNLRAYGPQGHWLSRRLRRSVARPREERHALLGDRGRTAGRMERESVAWLVLPGVSFDPIASTTCGATSGETTRKRVAGRS